jgi:hypothetical protein
VGRAGREIGRTVRSRSSKRIWTAPIPSSSFAIGTVKLGIEARAETAASRITWPVGYYTKEDYFVRDLQVLGMPAHLHRGQETIDPDGSVHNVRLKRHVLGEHSVKGCGIVAEPVVAFESEGFEKLFGRTTRCILSLRLGPIWIHADGDIRRLRR